MQLSEGIFFLVLLGFLLTAFVTIVCQLLFPSFWRKKNTLPNHKHRRPLTEEPEADLLSQEKLEQINAHVKEHFSKHKPFLHPDYSLQQMADELKTPTHHLSYFLNAWYGMNFRFFINDQRIHHFTSRIRHGDWKSKSLDSMAIESGFNNKTTFITSCKRTTGMTPSEYIKDNNEKPSYPMSNRNEDDRGATDTQFVRYIHGSNTRR